MNLLMFLAEESDAFVRLFTEMNAWSIVLFILGIIFVGIEMVLPGFGFFGISGTAMLILAIVLRLLQPNNHAGDIVMLLFMIVILAGVYVALFLILGKMIKSGKLQKIDIFNSNTSLPEGATEGTKDYSALLNQTGVTQTTLRPIGKVKFDNGVTDVVARDGFIDANKLVEVVEIEGQRIVVVEVE